MKSIGKDASLEISGHRVQLRLISQKEIELIRQWRNQDHIRVWFKYAEIISPAKHKAWWEAYQQRDNDLMFIIWQKAQTRPIGTVALYDIDLNAGSAEFGRLLIAAADHRGKGLAQEASQVLIDWARQELSLTRIYLEVHMHNAPAIAIYKKLGFSELGSCGQFFKMKLRFPLGQCR
ncbi:MAG: hypothetical protein BZ151_11740 [Desulfobacca sp. 4484_104]|nr:MAG: hypothetical protein BZ151_11740 [Desulfobacca sp. 4484_104]